MIPGSAGTTRPPAAGITPEMTDQPADQTIEKLRARFPRVAIVHEWLTIPGGSEDVVIELLKMFPSAELFTTVYDPSPWPALIKERPVHASFLNRIPGCCAALPEAVAADESRVSLVRSLGLRSGAFHQSRVREERAHSSRRAPRLLLPHADALRLGRGLPGGRGRAATRLLIRPLLGWLRSQDLQGSRGPDVFVANSRHVAARIRRFYGRSAEVVHPPVDVEHYLASVALSARLLPRLRAGRPLQAGRPCRGCLRARWAGR